MDAVGSGGERDVSAGVDQEGSFQVSVLSSELSKEIEGFPGQGFQFSRRQVFLAELDVIDSGAASFPDFVEETATAGGFVFGEGGAVGDVVEEAAFSHLVGHRG